MKWALIIVSIFLLPPIGILWSVYELWKMKILRDHTVFLDQVKKELSANADIKQKRHLLSEEKWGKEVNRLTISVDKLETLFRNGKLFENIRLTQEVECVFVSGYYWTTKRYRDFCAEVDRAPIFELIEYWEVKIAEQLDMFKSILNDHKNMAEKVKLEILQDLKNGDPWHRVWDRFRNNPDSNIEVFYANGVWTLSWENALAYLCAKSWISKNGPHSIHFRSDEAAC